MAKDDNNIIYSLFPIPVYIAKRDSNLSPKEEKEIEKIIEDGTHPNTGNYTTDNSYVFNDGKLKKLKQFCEQQLKIYAEKVIVNEEELNFYITQSWLNITRPGEYHHEHGHSNSIISGVFYISAGEDDSITFSDPNAKVKELMRLSPKEFNMWNSTSWFFPANNNELILFPSWLNHQVEGNEKATADRISLSFNTFIKGTFGHRDDLNELIL